MASPDVFLRGSIVALVTPFHEDGSVDYDTLRRLVDWHVAEGTDALVIVGTSATCQSISLRSVG